MSHGNIKYVANFQTNYGGRIGNHRMSFYCEETQQDVKIAVVCYLSDSNVKERLKYITDFLVSDLGD